MTLDDVSGVVRLHEIAFRSNFMTTFGAGFLRAFYVGLIAHSDGYGCVAVRGSGEIGGFCVGGSSAVQGIAREMFMRRPLPFLLPAAINVLRAPWRLGRVLRVARANLAGGGADAPPSTALLMQIAVDDELRGTGAAESLVGHFLEEMRRRGVDCVSLGVENDNERAIAFYRKMGFREARPGILEYQFASEAASGAAVSVGKE